VRKSEGDRTIEKLSCAYLDGSYDEHHAAIDWQRRGTAKWRSKNESISKRIKQWNKVAIDWLI